MSNNSIVNVSIDIDQFKKNFNDAIIKAVHNSSIGNNELYISPTFKELLKNSGNNVFTAFETLNQEFNKSKGNIQLKTLITAYEAFFDLRAIIFKDQLSYKFQVYTQDKSQIKQISITRAKYEDLIKNAEVKGKPVKLNQTGVAGKSLKLSSKLIPILQQLESGEGITVNYTSNAIEMVNKKGGIPIIIQDPKKVRDQIIALSNLEDNNGDVLYGTFQTTLINPKKSKYSGVSFSFSFKRSALTKNPISTTIFSAVKKYAASEYRAKINAGKNGGVGIDSLLDNPSTEEIDQAKNFLKYVESKQSKFLNIGNLGQIYELAKLRLNDNKNWLKQYYLRKSRVPGKELYDIFFEVRSNSDPFYMGGDVLQEQVKSFLGSCPTLYDFNAMKKAIENFLNIFSTGSVSRKDIQKRFKDFFIKTKDDFTPGGNDLIEKYNQNLTKFLKSL